MNGDNRSTLIVLTLLLGIVLQVVFVFADGMDSPRKAALEFTKAYYALDPAMAKRLCSEAAAGDEQGTVEAFIRSQYQWGEKMGFAPSFMHSTLIHPHVKVHEISDTEARVHLSAARKRNINPAFTWVGKIFRLGETYHVDEELSLIKEDGLWKVCGTPFELGNINS